jgi:hypothetical protein
MPTMFRDPTGSRPQACGRRPICTDRCHPLARLCQGDDRDLVEWRQVLTEQHGVIARRQLLHAGADDNLIDRMLRRNLWRSVHPGVYVDHNGPATDEQRLMAAVQYAWPAALAGESALVAHGVRNMATSGVRVAIDANRRVRCQPGVEILRLVRFDQEALWHRSPPRVRLEGAVIDVASRRRRTSGEAAAVAVLSDICQQRFSTPARLLDAVEAHGRLHGRAFLRSVLEDVASGAFSVLEHRYLTRVERPHGLPRAARQDRLALAGRVGFRDVHYRAQRLIVELDGRLGHEWATDQWIDLERDLAAAQAGELTVRFGWRAVASPCWLASVMGELLTARGWSGTTRRCPLC